MLLMEVLTTITSGLLQFPHIESNFRITVGGGLLLCLIFTPLLFCRYIVCGSCIAVVFAQYILLYSHSEIHSKHNLKCKYTFSMVENIYGTLTLLHDTYTYERSKALCKWIMSRLPHWILDPQTSAWWVEFTAERERPNNLWHRQKECYFRCQESKAITLGIM